MKNDFKVPAYLITTLILACFTILPFHAEIWAEITGDSPMAKAIAYNNAQNEAVETAQPVQLYDMSDADQIVVNIDDLAVVEVMPDLHHIWLGSHLVETNLTEQECAELFYTKEEIAIRVDGDRYSIIAGDNGEF